MAKIMFHTPAASTTLANASKGVTTQQSSHQICFRYTQHSIYTFLFNSTFTGM